MPRQPKKARPATPAMDLMQALRQSVEAAKAARTRPHELYRARVAYARRRIIAVLRRRVAAYRRELERLVCEVGFSYTEAPPEQRTEPHHLTEAIRLLKEEEAIREANLQYGKTNYVCWTLATADDKTVKTVLDRKAKALEVFQKVEHTPGLSGYHAESVHHRAMCHPDTQRAWASVGWKAGVKIHSLGPLTLDKPGDVDLAGHHIPSGGIPFVVQIKNGREWLYPPDDSVWDLLGAAAQLQAVPVLIARRMPDRMFEYMKIVGGFAFRSIHMILHPDLAGAVPVPGMPSFAEAVHEFGFHTDIDYITDPLPRHVELWTGPLGEQIQEIHERFLELTDEIMEVAYDEDLRNDKRKTGKLSGQHRRAITAGFATRMRERHRQEALEAYREANPRPEQSDHFDADEEDYYSP